MPEENPTEGQVKNRAQDKKTVKLRAVRPIMEDGEYVAKGATFATTKARAESLSHLTEPV